MPRKMQDRLERLGILRYSICVEKKHAHTHTCFSYKGRRFWHSKENIAFSGLYSAKRKVFVSRWLSILENYCNYWPTRPGPTIEMACFSRARGAPPTRSASLPPASMEDIYCKCKLFSKLSYPSFLQMFPDRGYTEPRLYHWPLSVEKGHGGN